MIRFFREYKTYVIRLRPTSFAIRILFFFLPFINVFSQSDNRMYFGVGYGWNRHWEVNANFHFLDHFAVSAYYGISKSPTGYYYEDNSGFFTPDKQYKSTYNYYGFLAGLTTNNDGIINIVGLIGLSNLEAKEFSNFHQSMDSYGNKTLNYDLENGQRPSLTLRFDVLFTMSESKALRLGLMQNLNSINNTFSAFVCINFGLFE